MAYRRRSNYQRGETDIRIVTLADRVRPNNSAMVLAGAYRCQHRKNAHVQYGGIDGWAPGVVHAKGAAGTEMMMQRAKASSAAGVSLWTNSASHRGRGLAGDQMAVRARPRPGTAI